MTGPPAPDPPGGSSTELDGRQRNTLLVTTIAGHGLKHFFAAAFFVLLPEIKTSLALTNVEVGLMSTARFVTGGIANLPAGFIADRFSRFRAALDPAALDALCLENIARFKRPKAYFAIAELPKNNYGKVVKTALRERLADKDEEAQAAP